MDKKFRLIKYLFLVYIAVGFSSCLKSGLEDLPAFDQAEIANIFVEHRFYDAGDKWIDDSKVVKFQRLSVVKRIVTAANSGAQTDSIIVTASIPQASGSFTPEERSKVSLSNIVVYMNISTAATIKPLEGAPILGKPGDFSLPRKYRITAANGKTFRDWVVVIKPLQ